MFVGENRENNYHGTLDARLYALILAALLIWLENNSIILSHTCKLEPTYNRSEFYFNSWASKLIRVCTYKLNNSTRFSRNPCTISSGSADSSACCFRLATTALHSSLAGK